MLDGRTAQRHGVYVQATLKPHNGPHRMFSTTLETYRLPSLLLKFLPNCLDTLTVDVAIRLTNARCRSVLHNVLPAKARQCQTITKSPSSTCTAEGL